MLQGWGAMFLNSPAEAHNAFPTKARATAEHAAHVEQKQLAFSDSN